MKAISIVFLTWTLCAPVWLSGCAPDRGQWMAQAANHEAQLATASMGSEQDVRTQARQAADMLNALTAGLLNKPRANQQVATVLARDFSQVSSGLDGIADSQTDEQFTAAVFAMCDTQRKEAAARVGQVMVGLASLLSAKPPPNVPAEQVQRAVAYDRGFGERLIDVPSKCEHASATMAQADAQEHQAELEHQENVNAAVTASAVVLGAALITAGTVAAAEASRPIIVQPPPPVPVRTVCNDLGNGRLSCVSQ